MEVREAEPTLSDYEIQLLNAVKNGNKRQFKKLAKLNKPLVIPGHEEITLIAFREKQWNFLELLIKKNIFFGYTILIRKRSRSNYNYNVYLK